MSQETSKSRERLKRIGNLIGGLDAIKEEFPGEDPFDLFSHTRVFVYRTRIAEQYHDPVVTEAAAAAYAKGNGRKKRIGDF